MIILEIYFLLH